MDYLSIGHIFVAGIIIIQAVIIFTLLRKGSRTGTYGNHLVQSEEIYTDLFENANDAIFILDNKQNYLDVNLRAVELFGYSREEFLKLNVRDVIPRTQVKNSDKEFSKLFENGKYEKFVGKQKTKDGRWLDIEVNSSAILDDGKIVGSRDIVRDITERKKQEKERNFLIADLKAALDEISTLRGMLQICVSCKKIRDEKGDWNRIESITQHSEAEFTHGCCPDCLKELYPELPDEIFTENNSNTD